MKIIISPAKLMNVAHKTDLLKLSDPEFIKNAALIQSFLKPKTPDFLQELMGISRKLADENWQRNQNWNPKPKKEESNSALFSFTGEVYRGLDAKTLEEKSLRYLQENLRILSGLYGVLNASDNIMPYRLEMGSRFSFDQHKNLYDFWKEKITNYFNKMIKKDELILNLASKEYSKSIDRKKLKVPMVEVEFYEIRDGKLKTIVVYTKHARGLLTRFCAENNVQTLEEAKAFNYGNYLLDDGLSSDKKLVFTRNI